MIQPLLQPLPASSSGTPVWLELDQAARLCGKSDRHLRRMAAENWMPENKARLFTESGKKPRWQIRSDADAAFAQPIAQTGRSASAPESAVDLRQFPKQLVKLALERKAILDRWQQALAGGLAMGMDRNAATNSFIALLERGGQRVPRATLYEWQARCKADGLPGLMDGRARRVFEDQQVAGPDAFLEEVKTLWLTMPPPSVALCHKMAGIRARQMGWQFHSLRHTNRFMEAYARDNPQQVILLRQGEEAYKNQCATHITRDYSGLQSNEIWNADHHQFDVLVQVGQRVNPKTGEVEPVHARPWLTAWQDLRSRKIVGWIIRATDPNTDAIVEALDNACRQRQHGVPHKVYTDNGRDFDCQALTGETKSQSRQRRRLHVAHDQNLLGGIYAGMKIEHLHAWPFSGQSKPIERFFGTVEGRFGITFATNTGNSPDNRPESLYGAPGKPHTGTLARGLAPTLDTFIADFATWVEVDYHQKIHTGDAMDTTPALAWEANLVTKRTCPEDLLELLLQRRHGPLKVGQNGLVHKGIWYGQYDLAPWFGKEVQISYDGPGVSKVKVWATDGRFLCVASANLRVAANATPEHLREALNTQRRANKLQRDAARLRPRMHMDRTDLLNEAAAADTLQRPESGVFVPPPSIAPIRSDLEDQLPAIRAGIESPFKKAVGDGTPPPTFSYQNAAEEATESFGSFVYHPSSEGEGHE